jgi:hypothetical protein
VRAAGCTRRLGSSGGRRAELTHPHPHARAGLTSRGTCSTWATSRAPSTRRWPRTSRQRPASG